MNDCTCITEETGKGYKVVYPRDCPAHWEQYKADFKQRFGRDLEPLMGHHD